MSKVIRKKLRIDWLHIANACRMNMQHNEIADFLGIAFYTLNRHCKKDNGISFKEFFLKYAEGDNKLIYGRPKKHIDWEMVKKSCHIQCTEAEIANLVEISENSLNRRCKEENNMTFKRFKAIHAAGGKASVRSGQFRLAKTNAQMAIHLGKNYLGQSDKMTINHVMIGNVSQICSDILIKHIKNPEKLMLAAEEFKEKISLINHDKKEIQYIESEEVE